MTGFFASQDDLADIASSVDYIESDIRSVRDTWNSDTGDRSAAFATVEAGQAFTELQSGLAGLLRDRAVKYEGIAQAVRDGRSAYQKFEDAVGETVDGIGETVSNAAEKVTDTVGDVTDSVTDTVSNATDRVTETVNDAIDRVVPNRITDLLGGN